jgi:hypothetical protein
MRASRLTVVALDERPKDCSLRSLLFDSVAGEPDGRPPSTLSIQIALDEQLNRILASLIRVERERRVHTSNDAFRAVRDDYTRRGALGHGRLPVDRDNAAGTEYETRARLWMPLAQRVMRDTGVQWTEEAGQALLVLLQLELQSDFAFLLETIKRYAAGSQPRMNLLDAAKDRSRVELEQEVAISVLREDRSRLPLVQQLSAPRYAAPLSAWRRCHALLKV